MPYENGEFKISGTTRGGHPIRDIFVERNGLAVRVDRDATTGGGIPAGTIPSGLQVGAFVRFDPPLTTVSHTISGDLSGHKVPFSYAGTGTPTPQTFTTEDDLLWRVKSVQGNTVTLISDTPTNAQLRLQGARRME